MSDDPSQISWHERKTYGDGTRQYGNARIEVFETTLATFGRETGQNSNDAVLSGGNVAIEYRLGVLSGSHLTRFLAALQWPTIEQHYRAVAADQLHRTSRRYREGLELLSATKKLWVMRIDDYGTTGLLGEDFDPGPFAALVRNSQDSNKKSISAGGRFGLGSSVLSATSAFDCVIFTSNLSSPVQGKTAGRLIGRTYLPWHKLASGEEFEGPFFFGRPDNGDERRRLSHWAQPALLNDLWLNRSSFGGALETGTTALIVGFFDPDTGIDGNSAPDGVLTHLADSFVDAFWPAISHGRLDARFSYYENDQPIFERVVDSSNIVHPFSSLLTDSDVISADVSLNIPKNRETHEGPFQHTARLLVKLLDPDSVEVRANEVATWRSPEMVVRYLHYPHLALGARPFRAALICGEALQAIGVATSAADKAAEAFLAKAEPPQHDKWTWKGTDLVADYWGAKTELLKFETELQDILRKLTRPADQGESDAPKQLRDLLSLPIDPGLAARRATVSRLEWLTSEYEALHAVVRLSNRSDAGKVSLRLALLLATEGGGGISIPYDLDSASGADVASGKLLTPYVGIRDIEVILRPAWTEVPVRPELSAVTLDVAVQELRGTI